MPVPGVEPTSPKAPTRDEIAERLRALVDGADPGPIADWAGQWLYADVPDVEDALVWNALDLLAGADLLDLSRPGTPPPLLHCAEDFRAWVAGFEAARHADEGGKRDADSRRAG